MYVNYKADEIKSKSQFKFSMNADFMKFNECIILNLHDNKSYDNAKRAKSALFYLLLNF